MSVVTKQFKIASWNLNYWGILYTPDNLQGKVPLVIFCHGAGETGSTQTSTSKLYYNGPLNFIKSGWRPNFMVLAMQSPSWSATPASIDYVLKNDPDILKYWDGKNALITGLSAGGETTNLYMDGYNNPTFTYIAMSPAGTARLNNPSWPHKTWYFSGDSDGNFTETAKFFAKATSGRLTIYRGGHCCWNTYYNPNYKETIDGKSMNIYEWAFSTPVAINKPPVAMAGVDQTVKLPADVILTGNGTDEDGTIVSALWTQVSGPSTAQILSPNGFTTQIAGLQQGTYTFRITVTDNQSLSASDDVIVVVEESDTDIKHKITITGKDGLVYEGDITGDITISL